MNDEIRQARRDLGVAIRELREAAGLSQHGLARLLPSTDQGKVSRYEAGRSTPSYEVLVRMARVLGVPASSILVRAEMDGAVLVSCARADEQPSARQAC